MSSGNVKIQKKNNYLKSIFNFVIQRTFKNIIMLSLSKRLTYFMLAGLGLLLIPFVAMFFTNEVQWGPMDFIVAAILIFSAVFGFEMVLRKVKATQTRLLLCGAVLVVIVLIWAELAVGLFGTPWAGN